MSCTRSTAFTIMSVRELLFSKEARRKEMFHRCSFRKTWFAHFCPNRIKCIVWNIPQTSFIETKLITIHHFIESSAFLIQHSFAKYKPRFSERVTKEACQSLMHTERWGSKWQESNTCGFSLPGTKHTGGTDMSPRSSLTNGCPYTVTGPARCKQLCKWVSASCLVNFQWPPI